MKEFVILLIYNLWKYGTNEKYEGWWTKKKCLLMDHFKTLLWLNALKPSTFPQYKSNDLFGSKFWMRFQNNEIPRNISPKILKCAYTGEYYKCIWWIRILYSHPYALLCLDKTQREYSNKTKNGCLTWNKFNGSPINKIYFNKLIFIGILYFSRPT